MLSVSDLKPGTQLGRYRLVSELGRGAMGLVFLAEDTVLHQQLCVKVLHPQLQMHPEAVERFHREILFARRVSHRGVCRLHDLHREQELLFLTMEFVPGTSLRDVLTNRSPLPLTEAVGIIRSICDALAAAHDVGVVHRDLKPRNIIVRDGGEVSLLDFGIATALDFGSSLTMPGVALGTNSYISPEVWAGRPATPKSDQFAVGVIFYNVLTNKMPFPSGGKPIPLDTIREGAKRPSTHRPGLPAALDAIVLRALSYDPTERFPDVRALGRALDDVLLIDEHTLPLASIPTVSSPSDDTRPLPPAPGEPGAWQAATQPLQPSIARFGPPSLTPTVPSSALADATVDGGVVDGALETGPTPQQANAFVPSESASWVVGGRPIDLPAMPKAIPGAARSSDATVRTIAELEPDDEPPKRGRGLLFAALAGAGAVAVIAFVATRGASDDVVARDTAIDVVAPPSVGAPPTDAPPPVEPPPVAPPVEAVPVAPVEPPPVAPPVEAVPVASPVEPEPVEAVARTGAASARRPKADTKGDAKGDTKAGRAAYQQAASALAKELGARGLRGGDDAELDRARAAASAAAGAGKWTDASDAIEAARARARDVEVDRALVERKLRHFNDAFDRVTDADLRARLDVTATRALGEFAGGRYDAANRALNEGFAMIEKSRR